MASSTLATIRRTPSRLTQLSRVSQDLGEVVAGVDLEHRERDLGRVEGLLGEPHHHDGVLAAREHQDGLLELGGDLAEDVDRLRLELVELAQPVVGVRRGHEEGVPLAGDSSRHRSHVGGRVVEVASMSTPPQYLRRRRWSPCCRRPRRVTPTVPAPLWPGPEVIDQLTTTSSGPATCTNRGGHLAPVEGLRLVGDLGPVDLDRAQLATGGRVRGAPPRSGSPAPCRDVPEPVTDSGRLAGLGRGDRLVERHRAQQRLHPAAARLGADPGVVAQVVGHLRPGRVVEPDLDVRATRAVVVVEDAADRAGGQGRGHLGVVRRPAGSVPRWWPGPCPARTRPARPGRPSGRRRRWLGPRWRRRRPDAGSSMSRVR